MKTKNYELYFSFYYYWYDWALPLHINIEWASREYTEIQLQILCFAFSFTVISHEYSKKVDKMMEEIKEDMKNG